ncbi:cytochrome c peroxidase [Planctomycetes bacterium K23_9]|uniref:Di-heme cytochrome c peroxidase n=1 Tax=Stieleria marina TaxID=1930275 RepID=A0A517NMX7_9BACT|nr:Di-heme cytochrome c peroxidase [Planctomycetes bacterium K23_9]
MRNLSLFAVHFLWFTSLAAGIELNADSSRDSKVHTAVTHRSPVDLAISPDQEWLVTVNETSDSASLIRVNDGQVVDELSVGSHPADVMFTPDGNKVLITSSWSGELTVAAIKDQKLTAEAVVQIGYQPCGIAITSSGDRAFVGLAAAGQVAEVDLKTASLTRRIAVGHWPRYLTLTPDDQRLAVGLGGEGKIAVLDTESGETLYDEPLASGINLGHMLTSKDGKYAYFTWMVYRNNPIDVGNLRRGWILASRIGRVRLDGPSYREAISLDVPRKAVADPHGIVISADEKRMIASAAGTHELLVYRLPDTPFVGTGGPGDLIDRGLENDRDRFDRIPVGGRPMGMQMTDNQTVYVANYLRDSVQIVDLASKEIVGEIELGESPKQSLVDQGREIFYDGTRSMDQWYSCHSCHQNGGVNSRPMDTMNDGTVRTFKTVLPLFDVAKTAPWTWHGWQDDLTEAMHKSITSTMLGEEPSAKDKHALIAYLKTLSRPPNPFRNDYELAESIDRGRALFHSSKTACADCHNGPHFTDGQVHDVGLGSADDAYEGYNTPSLIGTYQKVRWLHSGRAKTLERVVNELHSPEKVSGTDKLSEQESADLITYLKSL